MKYSIIPMTCLIFSPVLMVGIPVITAEPHVAYALYFIGPTIGGNGLDKFNDITYFSFYTFFKSGIDPDCIDMVQESKGVDE